MDDLLEEYAQCLSDIEVAKKHVVKAAARKKEHEENLELIKQKIENKADGQKWKSNKGTVTFRAKPPKLVISDENLIPDEWYIEKITRNLSKAAILAALKMDKEIEGATLSNGGQSIAIQIKDL